jgi:hypothetical protein
VPGTTPPSPEAPAPAPESPPQAGPATRFGDGIHEIGVDIQPGTYHTTGGTELCYWQRVTLDGSIVRNGVGQGPQVLDAAPGERIEVRQCGEWNKR